MSSGRGLQGLHALRENETYLPVPLLGVGPIEDAGRDGRQQELTSTPKYASPRYSKIQWMTPIRLDIPASSAISWRPLKSGGNVKGVTS